nr:Uncharacterised protein [Raoultella sp. NCTC 9187]
MSFTMNPRTNCRAWPRQLPGELADTFGFTGWQATTILRQIQPARPGQIRAGSIRDENDLSCGRHHGAPLSPQEWRALLRAKGWKQKELARRWNCVRNLDQ